MPQIFIDGRHVGGFDELERARCDAASSIRYWPTPPPAPLKAKIPLQPRDLDSSNGRRTNPTGAAKQLLLQKIYVKDLSFESPKVAEHLHDERFAADAAQHPLERAGSRARDARSHADAHGRSERQGRDAVLDRIAQAGIFSIQGYTAEERSMLIGSFCPNTLYPFAREAIADIVSKGGFPQLLLQPINFDALYAQARIRERNGGKQPQAQPQPVWRGEPH